MAPETSYNGKTEVTGVIGDPVAHTKSPQLQNRIFSMMDENIVYVPFHVAPENLEKAVNGLKGLEVRGFNVTVPHKDKIIGLLDDISEKAKTIGAVNTVKNENGRLVGYNTDAEGFTTSLRNESCRDVENENIVIIGAGGSARAIAAQMAIEGAKSICIINRTESKAAEIADIIGKDLSYKINWFQTEDPLAKEIFRKADIIINTTSAGLSPNTDVSPLTDGYGFWPHQTVFDIIYDPPKTAFLKKAEDAGCDIYNGIGMLFWQGLLSNELWMGRKINKDVAARLHKSFIEDMAK